MSGTHIVFATKKTEDQPVLLSRPIGEKFGMPTDDELLYASCPQPMGEDEMVAKAP